MTTAQLMSEYEKRYRQFRVAEITQPNLNNAALRPDPAAFQIDGWVRIQIEKKVDESLKGTKR